MKFVTTSTRRPPRGYCLLLSLLVEQSSATSGNLFLRGNNGVNSGNVQATSIEPVTLAETAAAASASDGTCSNYGTTGWHSGQWNMALLPADHAANGINFTWEECAKECCERSDICEFWTLRLNDDGACFMMAIQGTYSDTGGHIEGDYDVDCCAPPPPAQGAWDFAWSDEFDLPDGSPLDDNTWGFENGYVRNSEAQYYSTRLENSRIDNGHALIEARQDNWNGREYTSASRTTKGKKSFLYGRFSLRAKIDVRSGSWPAWWWLPDTGGWPLGGEIDMMEYYQWKLLFNVMDGQKRWTSVQPSLDTYGGYEFSKHFHTWTFDWSPDSIKLYLDGTLMNNYDVSQADGTGPDGENPFRRPGYLLMNQAIGGSAGGDPSNTQFPVRYRIDWVRQWVWNDAVADGVSVVVTDGSGTGVYKPGTMGSASAGQPGVGKVFERWTVVSGTVTLDDEFAETTTFVVPASGNAVELQASFVIGTPPTESPVAGPTPPPVNPTDGVCDSRYATTGWHQGTYIRTFLPAEAPGGSWDWQECARECALDQECTFWTLLLAGDRKCHLMKNKGDYIDTHSHVEGDRDLDCAIDGTTPPTQSPTMAPTQSPVTSPPTTSPTQTPSVSLSRPPVCNNDGVCNLGEDCNNCSNDCGSKTNGNPNSKYCCDGNVSPDCGNSSCSCHLPAPTPTPPSQCVCSDFEAKAPCNDCGGGGQCKWSQKSGECNFK